MSSPTILSESEAFQKLHSIGQSHLLSEWEGLAQAHKENLLRQITYLDVDLLRRQQNELGRHEKTTNDFEPFKAYFPSGNRKDVERGMELAREGRCATLVLAGGQGSRLRCQGPKGSFPISLVKQKTLFQLIAEKIKAASDQVGRPLPFAMMTSPLNHVETETFFVQHAFFGLSPAQTRFFYQRMWPLLDFEGNLFLQAPDTIARGPNGNGGVFRRMVEIGLWKKWQERGVEMVNVIAVDNPLALPIDYELFGFHARHGCDVSVKAATRRGPEEKVGVLSLVNGKPAVLEYTEHQLGEEYSVANLGLYCFSMAFIEKMSELKMPLHQAKKAVKMLGMQNVPDKPNAWKFEEYIFDVLPVARHCEALLYPRETCFAPLKNLCGEDSIESVQAALLASERRIFKQVSGVEPPSDVTFELSPEFYYPKEEFLKKWKGKSLPEESYIA